MSDDPGKKAQAIDDWDNLPLDPDADDWDDVPSQNTAQNTAQKDQTEDDFESSPEMLPDDAVALAPSSLHGGSSPEDSLQEESLHDDSLPKGSWNENPPDDWEKALGDSQDDSPAETGSWASSTGAQNAAENSAQNSAIPPSSSQSVVASSPLNAQEDWTDGQAIDPQVDDSVSGAGDSVSSAPDDSQTPEPRELKPRSPGQYPDPASSGQSASPPSASPERRSRAAGDGTDQGRNDFLKSLMDGDGDAPVPQKVELDLDGIFDQAKKEAEHISPEATHQPVEAPKPEEPPPVVETPEPTPPPQGPTVKKIPKYKMFIVLATVSLVILGLFYALYRIFFRSIPTTPQSRVLVVEPEFLTGSYVAMPGEKQLKRFTIMLNQPSGENLVLEMEIILHYRDSSDENLIDNEIVLIRDFIFRLTKSAGPEVLTDQDKRRQLQADLLATINNIESLKTDPTEPRITYVQISLLSRR
ncbi:MAG: hypothetical protein LBE31_04525 [Deltaproteobacteria bacterium]|nr:hypothetical protein [Deltaproteobacteria bacterium]